VTAERLVEESTRAGIDRTIVVQASTSYGYDNRYMQASVDAHPELFRGVCCVDVAAADAVSTIERWFADPAMVGMRAFYAGGRASAPPDWVGDPAADPSWRWASEHRIPVGIYPALESSPHLHELTDRFPDLVLVIDHLADITDAESVDGGLVASFFALADRPNVFMKVSSKNFFEVLSGPPAAQEMLDRAVERFGKERMVWGSNYPSTAGPLDDLVTLARKALSRYPDPIADNILGRTALRLFPQAADGL
jgi:predicted TIM-barrel fold metal-dependent hydrolase